MTNKKKGYSVAMIFLFVLLLVPTLFAIFLSIEDFRPILGPYKSDIVGFENYKTFLGSPVFNRSLSNTISISSIALLVGTVYTFFASAAIGGVKNKWAKSAVAVICAVTAFLPAFLVRFFFPDGMLNTLSPVYHDYIGVVNGLRLAGLVSLTALFTEDDVIHKSFKTTFLFLVIGVVTFFSPYLSTTLATYNPGIYEISETTSSYIYRLGFVDGSFGLASAAGISVIVVQMILAIPMIFLMKHIMGEEKNVIQPQPYHSAFSIFAIIPFIIFVTVFSKCSSLLPPDGAEYLLPTYANSFMISALSGLLVAVIAALVASIARNSGMTGIVCATLLCAATENFLSCYAIIKDLGLFNTHMGVILSHLKFVPVITLLMMFITKDNRGLKKEISATLIMAAAVFAMTWGDFLNEGLLLEDRTKYTTALLVREIAIKNRSALIGHFSTALFILIPILVVLAVSVVIALINKSKKHAQPPQPANQQIGLGQHPIQ